jgi:hypothetical protein
MGGIADNRRSSRLEGNWPVGKVLYAAKDASGIRCVGLLGSLTTHGDRGIRRSQVSLVLRVSMYYYHTPPRFMA